MDKKRSLTTPSFFSFKFLFFKRCYTPPIISHNKTQINNASEGLVITLQPPYLSLHDKPNFRVNARSPYAPQAQGVAPRPHQRLQPLDSALTPSLGLAEALSSRLLVSRARLASDCQGFPSAPKRRP